MRQYFVFSDALIELNKVVESFSDKTIKEFGFPFSNHSLNTSNDYLRETTYENSRLLEVVQNKNRLNSELKAVYDAVLSSIINEEGKITRGEFRYG